MKQNHVEDIIVSFQKRKRKSFFILCFLFSIVIILALSTLMIGQTYFSLSTILRVLLGENISGVTFTLITLRLPRMIAGLLCGFAFGIAGNTFQKFLGNPLASPDIIGVTAGSSVVAVFCILVLHMSGTKVSIAAVIGGLLVVTLIYCFSKDNHVSQTKIILIGIGFQTFLNAIISYFLLKAAQYDIGQALRWLNGSLNGIKIENLSSLLILIMIIVPILISLDRHISIMQLGDEFATTLGLKVQHMKLCFLICAVLLTAFATSLTGPIASVAFLSGPIAHQIDKSSHSHMFASGLIGAILVLTADLVAQNFLPSRYPVGIVTGMLGAPYLIILLLRMNRKGESTT